VRLSHHSLAARCCGEFAAERRAGENIDRQRRLPGAQQQSRSGICGQYHLVSWRTRLNADFC